MSQPQTNLVPFGKYKGQPVEVLQSDPSYCTWLQGQEWFAERFPNLRTIIINNFQQDADTPEHNLMQARFLDDDYLARCFVSGRNVTKLLSWADDSLAFMKDARAWLIGAIPKAQPDSKYSDALVSGPEWYQGDDEYCNHYFCDFSISERRWSDGERVLAQQVEVALGTPWLSCRFESKGWDVVISCRANCFIDEATLVDGTWKESSYLRRIEPIRNSLSYGSDLYIELKPSLGDDYPSVLRQIKSREKEGYANSLLLIDKCSSVIPLDQIKSLFSREDISVRLSSEIVASFVMPRPDTEAACKIWTEVT